ncbi:MAG: hypothetical protein N2257_04530 [Thermodesulfovibrionales bacterium]|nr:hypothetical protein [Thermodesulfovibrionales bacterium]
MLIFKTGSIFFSFLISLLLSSISSAAINVEDRLCIAGDEIMLSAEIRKGLFRKGGVIVEFFIDGRSAGRSLSGGDGVAYRAFTAQKTGLFRVTVTTEEERAEGLLLCLKRGQAILLIDIETLKENPFSLIPRKDSREVIRRLKRRFPVVYLYAGLMSGKDIKEWLMKNGFPSAPLLAFHEGIFSHIQELGLAIRAVVGSAQVAKSAGSYRIKTFAFEDIEGAIEVDSWLELEKKI